MRPQGMEGRRIKERVIMYQDQQKEVFNFLFTIFITVYIILLVFIQASLKFIREMATGPIKGILGMLGLFYNNSKEESRQPINLQSFFNLEDAVLDLTPIISKTNNLQQREDKNQEVNLSILRETVSPLPCNKPLIEQDKVYIIAQPMLALGTLGTPYFMGQNVLQFIEQYKRLCIRHRVIDDEKHYRLPEYYDYWIGTQI